jgi:CheY-like chemotaxis protein
MPMDTRERRLLIVDDEADEAVFLTHGFRDGPSKVQIRHADNGADALDMIRSFDPDLVLLDLNMPGMDGFDVLRAIKSDSAMLAVPTVIFSSSERAVDIERCYRDQANAYVVKPHSPDGYRRLAENIDRFWFESARV